MHVVDHTRESSRPGNAGEQKETRTRTQQEQEFLNAEGMKKKYPIDALVVSLRSYLLVSVLEKA